MKVVVVVVEVSLAVVEETVELLEVCSGEDVVVSGAGVVSVYELEELDEFVEVIGDGVV